MSRYFWLIGKYGADFDFHCWLPKNIIPQYWLFRIWTNKSIWIVEQEIKFSIMIFVVCVAKIQRRLKMRFFEFNLCFSWKTYGNVRKLPLGRSWKMQRNKKWLPNTVWLLSGFSILAPQWEGSGNLPFSHAVTKFCTYHI